MQSDSDEAAILRVIDEMYRAIWRKDLPAVARLHVEAPYTRRWAWWLPGTLVVREGWDAIADRLRQVFDDPRMPDAVDPVVRRRNLNIRIMGDMAWVTFEQEAPRCRAGHWASTATRARCECSSGMTGNGRLPSSAR